MLPVRNAEVAAILRAAMHSAAAFVFAWLISVAPPAAAAELPAASAASAAASPAPSAVASSPSAAPEDRTAARPDPDDPHELRQIVQRAVDAVRTEPELLFKLTEDALALLQQHPDADLEAQVRVLRCDYFNERDRKAADREITRLRDLAPQLRNDGHRAAALGCEGEAHEHAGENVRAMALYEQAVGVAEAAHDERRLAEVLYLRGYLRGVLGEFTQGLADLKRSLALYEKLGLAVEGRTVTNAVAGLYSRIGDLDEARRYYEESLRKMPAGKASRERVIALHNLGRNHERAGNVDDAQRLYEQVLAGARELRYLRGEVHALRGLAAVRNARGDGERALAFIDEAQHLYGQVPDEPLRARLLVQRATALRLLRRPADGVPALRDAIRIFVAGDAVVEEGEAREELARAAADLGEWREAYHQQTRARQITQGLLRKQVDHRFAALKAQFDADAREREVKLLQRENEAAERALVHQQRAASLQIVAAVLASALAALLAVLAWRQRQTGRRMHELAMTDDLTGLPNRRRAIDTLETLLQAQAGGIVLIVDIDHFKRINDRHGHATGDAVLRAVSHAWRGAIGERVMLGRLGGEEFVVIAPGGEASEARALAERLRAAVTALDLSATLGVSPVTISIGATLLGPGDTVALALSRADAALYRAKEGGRDRVETLP